MPCDRQILRATWLPGRSCQCTAARATFASAASLAGEEPPAGYPSRDQRKAAALVIMRWLVQLGQAPALRGVICQELQAPAVPSAAIGAAAALVATPGLPREAAAVARMLQQQREVLLGSLGTVLPMPGAQDAIHEARRPLPLLGSEPERYSLLYWQLSTLLQLDGRLVEVSLWALSRRGVCERLPAGQASVCQLPMQCLWHAACVRHSPAPCSGTLSTTGAGHAADPAAVQHALQGGVWAGAAGLLPTHRL